MKTQARRTLGCLLLVSALSVGCGPNPQIVRLKRQVRTLKAEKQKEIQRLQREKFEAMQVRRVALERKQKQCNAEVLHLRNQHRKLSFQVTRSMRQIQDLLSQIMSSTLLMPLHLPSASQEPSTPVYPSQKSPTKPTPGAKSTAKSSPKPAKDDPQKTSPKP